MFVGRRKELQDLNKYYAKKDIEILVLYGQIGIGKTTLLKKFLEEKDYFYYKGVSCSSLQQREFIAGYLTDIGFSFSKIPSYEEIFSALGEGEERKIFVIDEFQNLGKTDAGFFESLKHHFIEKKRRNLFLILCSSCISWSESLKTENRGFLSFLFEESFYKLGELAYQDFKEFFPNFTKRESIQAYSILGGIPGLWNYFKGHLNLRENIENTFLKEGHPLSFLGQQLVAEELRETAIYNTILYTLAQGKEKLNEVHHATGFSRAKISVYLKNLIQLDLVEKVVSIETKGKEFTKKGSYRICHSYLKFYYRYLFSNQYRQKNLNSTEFYDRIVAGDLICFSGYGFKKVCREFVERENRLGRLPGDFTFLGYWIGKEAAIDFVYEDKEEEEVLAGICNWEKERMTLEDYQIFLDCKEKSGILADLVILFSAGGFDNHLRDISKKNPRVALVSLEQMG